MREQKAADRTYEELHKKLPFQNFDGTDRAAEFSHKTPYRYDDGVTIIITPVDHSPDDKFLTDPRAPMFPRGGDDVGDQA